MNLIDCECCTLKLFFCNTVCQTILAASGQRCCEINWLLLLSYCRSWQVPDGYFSMKKLVYELYSCQKKPIMPAIFFSPYEGCEW